MTYEVYDFFFLGSIRGNFPFCLEIALQYRTGGIPTDIVMYSYDMAHLGHFVYLLVLVHKTAHRPAYQSNLNHMLSLAKVLYSK